MGVSRPVRKVLACVLGGLLILGGLGMMFLTFPYLTNTSTTRLFEGRSWVPIVFVYGICTAVIIFGVLQIISCKWNIPTLLVLSLLTLVSYSWDHGVFGVLRDIYRSLDCQRQVSTEA